MRSAKLEDLKEDKKSAIEATYPGGLAQLRTDYQNATTVPQLKAVLAKIFKMLLGM